MRYSDWEQREMDAKSFAEDDKRRAAPIPVARERLPNVTVPKETDLDDDIKEAIDDSFCDGEGNSSAYYLRHHLAKHGLVIVEASKWDAATTALQLIGSVRNSYAGNAGSVARIALKKMEL